MKISAKHKAYIFGAWTLAIYAFIATIFVMWWHQHEWRGDPVILVLMPVVLCAWFIASVLEDIHVGFSMKDHVTMLIEMRTTKASIRIALAHFFVKCAGWALGVEKPEVVKLLPRIGGANLTFAHLAEMNAARAKEWNGSTPWNVADRIVETVGELGELANVIKKIRRIECGMPGNDPTQLPALIMQRDDEMGDVQICISLLANEMGIDLAKATVAKFNKTSDKVGFPHKLKVDP